MYVRTAFRVRWFTLFDKARLPQYYINLDGGNMVADTWMNNVYIPFLHMSFQSRFSAR
jgi:hypothetical protein